MGWGTKLGLENENLQQCRDAVLCRRRGSSGGHPDLKATTKDCPCDVVFNHMGKVSLINYCEHIVAACDSICNKARVLEHEDFVLRVRNDRSMILRDLYHGQPPEIDHAV
jgi:hypothetical protein